MSPARLTRAVRAVSRHLHARARLPGNSAEPRRLASSPGSLDEEMATVGRSETDDCSHYRFNAASQCRY
ncbi:jg21731 [Pararge aegeria aegeria]|uniref:Jg21731 protein n=1 Tax=Pararge aegeria aegeria TaxID=348720 RepID=A0A8S4S7Q1_9NEOP|nr:jg21731 [Pararge aegeria aegeria]